MSYMANKYCIVLYCIVYVLSYFRYNPSLGSIHDLPEELKMKEDMEISVLN